jgi:hypothetical protein
MRLVPRYGCGGKGKDELGCRRGLSFVRSGMRGLVEMG